MNNITVNNNDTYKYSNNLFMHLGFDPKGSQANSIADSLTMIVREYSAKRKNVTKRLRTAAFAIAADLLWAYGLPDTPYIFRPARNEDFLHSRISRDTFRDVIDAFVALGFAKRRASYWAGSHQQGAGNAASYRILPPLVELFLKFGITPGNHKDHFDAAARPEKVAKPIIIRAKRNFSNNDHRGKSLRIHDKTNPAYLESLRIVQDINLFWSTQNLTGAVHNGFCRIFNHGDQRDFSYNMGGRLYSLGKSYQNMEKTERKDIKINSEKVVELDLRASFLTILYALNDVELDPAVDPYDIGSYPRAVVKTWIAMTLGYDRFHAKWPEESVKKLAKSDTDPIDLRAYPIDDVRTAVLAKHPLLQDWSNSRVRWPTMQYLESQVIIRSVHILAYTHNVAVLPLHDAILVGKSNVSLAEQVVSDAFIQIVGAAPVLTVKER